MHPVLFELFGYPVHLYAVMIATGFVVAIWLAVRHGERIGYDRDMVLDMSWWMLVSGLIGSRIVFIIVNWEQYYFPCVDVEHYNSLFPSRPISEPDCWRLLRFWTGGLVYYGGVLGAFLTLFWFMRREKLATLPMLDAMIPYLAIGQFFGRFGCVAAGCCWGKVTDLPWGIEFPAGSMAFRQHAQAGLLEVDATHALAIHPTQLYDSLTGLALFGILLWIRHRKRYHGHVFVWWMFVYPLMRSTVELFRGDDSERGFVFEYVSEPLNQLLGLPTGSTTFLSTSQFISLCVVVVAAVMLFRRRRSMQSLRTAGSPTGGGPG